MADRTVRVNLVADTNNLVAGMDQARTATQQASDEVGRLAARRQAMTELGTGMLAFGALAAAGAVLAIKKFAEFDQAMSQVQAATQESAKNMGLLRDAAVEAGADTQYSATEAANAIEELGKAGLSTEQILSGGLNGALTLAAAGGIGVAEAAGYAAIAMKQFGLEGSALPHVADLFAAGAGKAVGDVSDLAQALGQVGLVANGAGQSIEDTTGVLAAFADAGLLGSDSGTSLKTAIVALQAPTLASQKLMDKYNLSFYDGNGAMLSYSEIAGQLTSRLGKYSDEERNATLAKIFGNDALRAANVLYEQGEKGIQKYIDQTNDSGYAAKVAADRMNNLAGDIEKLGGSFDTALIQTGSGANESLRTIVQSITTLIDTVGSLPAPVLNVAGALTVASGILALTGGAALVAVPKLIAAKAAFGQLGVSGKVAAIGIGATFAALTVALLAFSAFAAKNAEAKAASQEFTDSLDDATGALTKYSRELLVKKLTEANAFENAKAAGVSQAELVDSIIEGGDRLEAVNAKLSVGQGDIGKTFDQSRMKASYAKSTVKELTGTLAESKIAWDNEQAASASAAGAADASATALSEVSDSAADATQQVGDLAKAISDFGKTTLDSRAANRSFEASIDDAAEAAKKNGKTLDANTEKGRANQAALDSIASSANAVAAAKFTETGSTEKANKSLERGRENYIKTARAMGATRDEAKRLADKLIALPTDVTTEYKSRGLDTALRGLNYVLSQDGKNVKINLGYTESGRPVNKGQFSSGGYTGAIGRKNVAGVVHGNEFVNNADSTAKPENRKALEFMNSGGSMNDYASARSFAPAPVYVSGSTTNSAPRVQNNFTFQAFRAESAAEVIRTGSQIANATLGLSL